MSTYNESERPSKAAEDLTSQPLIKKPYQKPSFRFEQVFETMALACGKVSPTQQQCRSLQKS